MGGGGRQRKDTHRNRPRNGTCSTQLPGGRRSRWLAQRGGLPEASSRAGHRESPAVPPGRRAEALPSLRLKSLQPHLRPIVLAENLGQGHRGEEGILPPLLPWKCRDRGPARSPGNQLALLVLVQGQCELGRRAAVGSRGCCRVQGPGRTVAAALITPALQVPISFEKDSRDAACNNYQ